MEGGANQRRQRRERVVLRAKSAASTHAAITSMLMHLGYGGDHSGPSGIMKKDKKGWGVSIKDDAGGKWEEGEICE